MLSRCDIVAVGGATEDMFLTVDEYALIDNPSDLTRSTLVAFEYGAKIGVTSLERHFGGGGANVAVAGARLGLKTALVGCIGDDERGAAIKRNLLSHRVNVKGIRTISKAVSGVSFVVITKAHEHTVFTYRGANTEAKIDNAALRLIAGARWTYVTSLSGNWKASLKNIFEKAGLIAWNPGRLQLQAGFKALSSFLKKCAVLIVNKDEAIELVMSHPKHGRDGVARLTNPRQLAKVISEFGPACVVITDGARGAVAYDGKYTYACPAAKAKKVIDTTGVGDAFGGAFIVGLERYDGDIAKALQLGASNSASVVAHQGAQRGLIGR